MFLKWSETIISLSFYMLKHYSQLSSLDILIKSVILTNNTCKLITTKTWQLIAIYIIQMDTNPTLNKIIINNNQSQTMLKAMYMKLAHSSKGHLWEPHDFMSILLCWITLLVVQMTYLCSIWWSISHCVLIFKYLMYYVLSSNYQ